MEPGNRRFNLLLLDHDEYLLESAAAEDVTQIAGEGGMRGGLGDGRLWICSRCLVFEPRDFSLPLEKYRFDDMAQVPGGASLVSNATGQEEPVLLMEASALTKLKQGGKSRPYETYQTTSKRVFKLKHRSIEKTLALIKKLWSVRRDLLSEPRGARASMEQSLLRPILEKRKNQPFDKSRLLDFREQLRTPKELRVSLISQLTDIPGCILLTDQHLYFQPAQLNNIGEVVQAYSLSRLTGVYKRRFLLRQRALEVRFCKDYPSFSGGMSQGGEDDEGTADTGLHEQEKILLVCFEDGRNARDVVHDLLFSYLQTRNGQPRSIAPTLDLLEFQHAWQERRMSNFEYLMQLNTLADRSIADLTQYPVFPWVIADYTSTTLDLTKKETFRDLSKPIGALNPTRLLGFKERFEHMLSDSDSHVPPFLYGTHYTTPGYVLYYLVRRVPDLMLRLQNGEFDRPDRSFHSMDATWNSVMNNTADLKELIPEFYASDGEFLVNMHNLDLGQKQDGEFVDDVKLPPWCSSPRDFVEKCRQALESDYVSAHLHEWIDLIFGFKQRGEAAIEADNLFYYLTYEGAVDLDKVQDPNERKSYEAQIYEFGQTPKQLFSEPHPPRVASSPDESSETLMVGEIPGGEFVNKEAGSPITLTPSSPAQSPILQSPSPPGLPEKPKSPAQSPDQKLNPSANDNVIADELYVSVNSPQTSTNPMADRLRSTRSSSSTSSSTSSRKTIDGTPKVPMRVDFDSLKSSSFNASSSSISSTPTHFHSSGDHIVPHPSPSPRASSAWSGWWRVDSNTLQNYEGQGEVKAHRGLVSWICSSEEDDSIFSASHDGSVTCLSVQTRCVKRRMAVGQLALSCCTPLRDGNLLVGSWDDSLYVSALEHGRVVNRINAHDAAVSCMATNSSGRMLVTGSWDSTLKVWSVRGSKQISCIGAVYDHESEVTALDVDASGSLVLSASKRGDVLLHDLRIDQVVMNFPSCKDRGTHAVSVHWTQNETTVAICGKDGVVDLYDLASGSQSPAISVDALLPPESYVTCSIITPDRLCAVLGTSCGRVSLCNVNFMGSMMGRSAARTIYKTPRDINDVDGGKRSRTDALNEMDRSLPTQSITALHCTSNTIFMGTCAGTIKFLSPLAP